MDEVIEREEGAEYRWTLMNEDTDLAFTASEVRLGTGLFPSLRASHLIPARRLTRKHLTARMHACAISERLLRYGHMQAQPTVARDLLATTRELRRYLRTRGAIDSAVRLAMVRGGWRGRWEIARMKRDGQWGAPPK